MKTYNKQTIADLLDGRLHFQNGHHLLPNMPRNKLREAQTIVKQFCTERGIPYYETGLLQSYRYVVEALREITALAGKGAPREQRA